MCKLPILILGLTFGLGGCSSEQLYDFGSGFREKACDQYGGAERVRCLENADKPYSQYEREREAATKPKPLPNPN